MATYYVDLENGNDANDGLSFANRKKTPQAVTASPGDTVRIMASPDATAVGTGTWFTNNSAGNKASSSISAATNTTPIQCTYSNHELTTGDVIMIYSGTGMTSINGWWQVTVIDANTFTLNDSSGNGAYSGGSAFVRFAKARTAVLNSPVNKNLTLVNTGPTAREAWTSSTNVVASQVTGASKFANYTDQFAINSTFTTGKVAYKTFSSTQNLSGYEQISFQIRLTSGVSTSTSTQAQLKLCSDTVGNTAVHTIDIPPVTNGYGWYTFTIDFGTPLSSNINSIAFYMNSDLGAQTWQIFNVVACKSKSSNDSITLHSLIGKNTATVEGKAWYQVGAIVNNILIFDWGLTSLTYTSYTPQIGGEQESITIYKREPIVLPAVAATSTISLSAASSGSAGNQVVYDFGWNRSDMSSKTGDTWISITNGIGVAFALNGLSYVTVNNIGVTRATTGVGGTTAFTDCVINDVGFSACNAAVVQPNASNITNNSWTIDSITLTQTGLQLYNATTSIGESTASVGIINGCSAGVQAARGVIITNIDKIYNCHTYCISTSGYTRIKNINSILGSKGNVIANISNGTLIIDKIVSVENAPIFISAANNTPSSIIVSNATVSGLTTNLVNGSKSNISLNNIDVTSGESSIAISTDFSASNIRLTNVSGTNGLYTDLGTALTTTTVRHTASGYAWQLQPKIYASDGNPFRFPLAQVAVSANNQVTAKAWLRRNDAALPMRLICPGGQIQGVTNDVSSSITSAADTWQEVTITFTPTATGVVGIFVDTYNSDSLTGYVDDVTITQA